MTIRFSKTQVFVLCTTLVSIMLALTRILPVIANDGGAEQAVIEETIRSIEQIYNQYHNENRAMLHQRFMPLIVKMIDLEKLAPQIIQKQWPDLNRHEQERFTEALAVAIAAKTVDHLESSNGVVNLSLKVIENKNSITILEYTLDGNKKLTAYLFRDDFGDWKLRDVKVNKRSIRQYYYGFCKKLIDKYALAYAIAKLKRSDYVVLEDFESSTTGQLPYRWAWKDKDDDRPKPYRIQQEHDNKYLAATDQGESVIIGKDIKWNLHEYPYISFRWRAHNLPEGGDERFGKTVDSAAGIYFTVKMKFGLVPESIKYVWSTTLPVGSAMRRSGIGRPWMVVAESGEDQIGEWHTYVFNLYEAYKATFGGDPPQVTAGIGILSDANSTKSKAYADYDDIRALRHSDVVSSEISQILDAE